MYLEIENIKSVGDSKTRIKLFLAFLEEYSAWFQHLSSVGSTWGNNTEEAGANTESKKCLSHIKNLEQEILTELLL